LANSGEICVIGSKGSPTSSQLSDKIFLIGPGLGSSNIASNRLEEWLEEDEDITQNLDFKQKSFYNNERTSIPFSEKKEDDPWI